MLCCKEVLVGGGWGSTSRLADSVALQSATLAGSALHLRLCFPVSNLPPAGLTAIGLSSSVSCSQAAFGKCFTYSLSHVVALLEGRKTLLTLTP